ncbi:SRPBCC family protein [Solwaraspora sp. WMMB335]|uniref:SRPBCC family protein n=1 Tax=Solwaraspora sp. WMMB335 TaxID=3404118 RepID=UPI003B94009E
MIEASYTLDIDVGVDEVWSFVEVIPNWAHFLVGFQKLELVDDRRSRWTLRGDVGILAREVDLQADITVWEPRRRAEFTITGLTERITGQGSFELEPVGAPAVAQRQPVADRPRRPLLRRIRFALVGRLLRWLNRRADRQSADRPADQQAPAASEADRPAPGAAADRPATGGSRLRFHLQLTPGGPMAPMVELLMAPMVEPTAEDFLRNIRQALQARRTTA